MTERLTLITESNKTELGILRNHHLLQNITQDGNNHDSFYGRFLEVTQCQHERHRFFRQTSCLGSNSGQCLNASSVGPSNYFKRDSKIEIPSRIFKSLLTAERLNTRKGSPAHGNGGKLPSENDSDIVFPNQFQESANEALRPMDNYLLKVMKEADNNSWRTELGICRQALPVQLNMTQERRVMLLNLIDLVQALETKINCQKCFILPAELRHFLKWLKSGVSEVGCHLPGPSQGPKTFGFLFHDSSHKHHKAAPCHQPDQAKGIRYNVPSIEPCHERCRCETGKPGSIFGKHLRKVPLKPTKPKEQPRTLVDILKNLERPKQSFT